ncbi:MAG: aldehyde dehydrogenase family protein [Acidobacteriia bacterium]|nr:aldehyde dehydrogenase family protein [Terriglobia bacterium]
MQLPEFRNEPLSDFKGNPEHFRKMKEAVEEVGRELGRDYPLVIGGERITTADKLISHDPGQKDRVVGVFSKASRELAERAVRCADEAFKNWSRVPYEERVELVQGTARILRERKHYYSAWLVYEVGKSWAEADADVAETIDFAEFYSREMLRLGGPQPLTPVAGEKNYLKYIPLGVGVVIPPWNFPMAILGGMTVASIVAGNTVVLKPSSDSPAIGYQFMEALEKAGMPPGVVNFCPCPGGSVGDVLVGHPRTRYIAFTGSKDVGLHINELAAKTPPGQVWIKRVVAEMGGKDSIIVDSETDLDQAVEGVTVSAFGYQGQKCSACSRAIVDEKIYDAFLEKLKARVEKIKVGPPTDPETYMGPVINAGSKKMTEAAPGGLLGIATKLDPALTKSDALAGQVAGHIGALPPVWDKLKFHVTLMERVVGSSSELVIEPLKHHEPLMLSVGTAVTVGVVTNTKKDLVEVALKRPVCAELGARIAISRQVGARWRLIGMGVLAE